MVPREDLTPSNWKDAIRKDIGPELRAVLQHAGEPPADLLALSLTDSLLEGLKDQSNDNICSPHERLKRACITAYIDDTNVVGSPRLVAVAIILLKALYRKLGIEVRDGKTQILIDALRICEMQEVLDLTKDPLQVGLCRTEVIKILGIPVAIGGEADQDNPLHAHVFTLLEERFMPTLEALRLLASHEPQLAYITLRMYVLPKLRWLAEGIGDKTPPSVWTRIDQCLNGILESVVDNPLVDHHSDEWATDADGNILQCVFRTQLGLPIKMGGLGIPVMAAWAPAVARQSRAKRVDHARNVDRTYRLSALEVNMKDDLAVMYQADADYVTNFLFRQLDGAEGEHKEIASRDFAMDAFVKLPWVLDTLHAKPWCPGERIERDAWIGEMEQLFLKLRCWQAQVSRESQAGGTRFGQVRRHDIVKESLGALFKRYGCAVELEPSRSVTNPGDPRSEKRGDIRVTYPDGAENVIDVSITGGLKLEVVRDPDSAVDKVVKRKRKDYQQSGTDDVNLLIGAMTTTGVVHETFREFLGKTFPRALAVASGATGDPGDDEESWGWRDNRHKVQREARAVLAAARVRGNHFFHLRVGTEMRRRQLDENDVIGRSPLSSALGGGG
jgi:hypothetical protein